MLKPASRGSAWSAASTARADAAGVAAGRRLLAQAPRGTAKPGSVHAAHPLAQGEAGHQAGPDAKSSPQKDLGPAQSSSRRTRSPLTEEIVLPIKLTFFRNQRRNFLREGIAHG